MSKRILRELPELIDKKVISEETAEAISRYYRDRQSASPNRLNTAFGILGAALVGLGIILIIAHNWDDLGRLTKTIFAFAPLVAAQALCGYVLIKKTGSAAWRESASVLLFFAVGASISLVSQIYHIPGNFSSFMSTWMFLMFPVIYLLRSGFTSLLYIIGMTAFACAGGYYYPTGEPYAYWLLLALIMPFYLGIIRKNPDSNSVVFHHWLIALSVTIVLGTVADHSGYYLFAAYMSLFGLFYLTGKTVPFRRARLAANPYRILGALGTFTILLMLSYDWFWLDLAQNASGSGWVSVEMLATVLLTLAAAFVFLRLRRRGRWEFDPLEVVFAIFLAVFFIGMASVRLPVLLINLTVFGAGIFYALKGARSDRLDLLNFGLLVIAALATCRFFDDRLSFILRGSLFLAVGIGFFLANYFTLKKRKLKRL